jgi:hypothetical protein
MKKFVFIAAVLSLACLCNPKYDTSSLHALDSLLAREMDIASERCFHQVDRSGLMGREALEAWNYCTDKHFELEELLTQTNDAVGRKDWVTAKQRGTELINAMIELEILVPYSFTHFIERL